MNVVSVLCQKGGSGKTTVVSNLAVAAWQNGHNVVLVDTDRQGTLAEWHEARRTDDFVLRVVVPSLLTPWLEQMRYVPGESLVIIDTPGQDNDEIDAAVAAADLCLVPILPSAFDLRAMSATARRIAAHGRPFAFVLNAVSPSSIGRTIDATAALQAAGTVAPVISHRLVFRDAATLGLGVTEIEPAGKAANEINQLWLWLKDRMGAPRHGTA